MSDEGFRMVRSWYSPNNGNRTLANSVVAPEVRAALAAWAEAKVPGVLIGGLALSYWSVPRHTQDIDVLTATPPLPPVQGFKRIRPHAWMHVSTGVEVEILDPHFLNLDPAFLTLIEKHASSREGVRIASPEGLVALKLKRFSRQDQADIENLLKLSSKERVLDQFGSVLTIVDKNRLSEF